MIDLGKINEAENILLDSIDYTNNNEVIEVALFISTLVKKIISFGKQQLYKRRSAFWFQTITYEVGI